MKKVMVSLNNRHLFFQKGSPFAYKNLAYINLGSPREFGYCSVDKTGLSSVCSIQKSSLTAQLKFISYSANLIHDIGVVETIQHFM